MVRLARRAARIPFAPVVALMFGVAAAILVAAMPIWMFERAVLKTGLPALLSIAGPPLGLKARLLGIVLAFAAAAGLAWLVATPFARWLERDRRRRTPWRDAGYGERDGDMPDVAARRRPIFAPDELGAPLMSDEAIVAIAPPFERVPELEATLAIEEFDVAPEMARPAPGDDAATAEDTSIYALIRRLEAGLARRGIDPDPKSPTAAPLPLSRDWIVADAAPASPPDDARPALRDALGTLRRLVAAR